MKNNCLEHCRIALRLGTRQVVCWVNKPRMYGAVLWCCNCSTAEDQGPDGGPAPVESQQHLETCKAYLNLQEGRDMENNFEDMVKFSMHIMVERTKKK